MWTSCSGCSEQPNIDTENSEICTLKPSFVDKLFKIKFKTYLYGFFIQQEGSLLRVLEVMKAGSDDVNMLKSAITQLSLMTEDSSLHTIFLDNGGMELAVGLLKSSVVSWLNHNSYCYCYCFKFLSSTFNSSFLNSNLFWFRFRNYQIPTPNIFSCTQWLRWNT